MEVEVLNTSYEAPGMMQVRYLLRPIVFEAGLKVLFSGFTATKYTWKSNTI